MSERVQSDVAGLFRTQAAQPVAKDLAGPFAWQPPYLNLLAASMAGLILAAVIAVLGLGYADKVNAKGWVVPAAQAVQVVSPAPGILVWLGAQLEADVTKGQQLAQIDNQAITLQGATTGQMHEAQLKAKQSALQRQWVYEQKIWRLQERRLKSAAQALLGDLENLHQQTGLLRQKLTLAQSNETRVRTLSEKRFVSQHDVARMVEARLHSQSQFVAHRQTQHSLTSKQVEVRTELALLAAQIEADNARYAGQIEDLSQQHEQAQANQGVVVTAPVAGQVVNLLVHAGQSVTAGQVLFSLLPNTGDKHKIEAVLASEAAARVEVGMPVRLRYRGYPFQEFGSGSGKVVAVSPLSDGNPLNPGFRVKIQVEQLPLKLKSVAAGMTVDVDILLQQQSLWHRLMNPLRSVLERL